ncbi:MAG: exodeoxyribonuclease VII small subunit [Tissierellaceae bacterium]|nr:exodeoxyribonuclease VII small subunit [Tissierellaceae bacterium]
MDVSKLSYEDAVKELEDIICFLEQEDYSLKDAMDKFKNGVELYKHCNTLLTKAEGEIKILLGDDEQTFEELNLIREADEDY